MIIALIFLSVLDIWSTLYALKLGGAEQNAFLRWCFALVGPWKALVLLKVAALAVVWYFATETILLWIVGGYTCLIINNLYHITILRSRRK